IQINKMNNVLLLSCSLQVDCQGYPRNFCTLELQRMCGSDGQTYSNKCFFCNAFVKSRGRLSLIRYGPCYGAASV
uniref:Kazal-like domain-containing protein n=1 Tax=Podarcis muralis TaxID=64176 RepID=A0A670II72_PODMU